MTKKDIAGYIDQTQLKIQVSLESIETICLESRLYEFATVAIHPCYIEDARKFLEGSNVGITAALAFPYGAWSAELKKFEIEDAVAKGATDCDFVINVGALKDGKYDVLKKEAEVCRKAATNKILKAIFEVCVLTDEEIVKACEIYSQAGVDFVKTSTGFIEPPTPRIVKLMSDSVAGTSTKVKAAGGIRSAADAKTMVEAGAARLGTSAGLAIYQNWTD
jgi:deoxyribose-phosphate aldolase